VYPVSKGDEFSRFMEMFVTDLSDHSTDDKVRGDRNEKWQVTTGS
jgi:hypothetical protein